MKSNAITNTITSAIRTLGFLFSLLAVGGQNVLAQYEDFAKLADSSAAAAKADFSASFKGVKVVREEGLKGSTDVSLSFQFSRKPTVFFHYYDAQKKAVVFDFYDTRPGKPVMDSVREAPFTRAMQDSLQIDLNKDTKGLEPDFRHVTRVSLFTPYDLEYEVQDDKAAIIVYYKWSPSKEAQLKKKGKGLYWQIPLAAAVAGGGGFVAYKLWVEETPVVEEDVLSTSKIPARP